MRKTKKRRRTLVRVLVGVALLAAACSDSAKGDKAGGAAEIEPHELIMAQPNGSPPDQLVSWAEEVSERSGGTLTIKFKNDWRIGDTDFESATIEDVRAGKVDLAWVGARVFDRVGVDSFQALLAPMLVDSHDLQAAVFEAGIPDQMLRGLDEIDLVGIGVLPGPMRKILGISEPFVEPADFAGKTIGLQDSALAADTLKALGATPRVAPSGADLDGLDAYEQQLASIVGNRYYAEADYVTANVNLWPRPLVIVMGTEVLEGLAPSQQNALREAAADAIPAALDDSRAEDEEAVTILCREGMTLAMASDAAIASLRAAVTPEYEKLNSNPTTRAHVAAIQELKDSLGLPADAAKCPKRQAAGSPTGAGFPQGTFVTTLTQEDWGDIEGDVTKFAMIIDPETIKIVEGGVGGEIGFNGVYTVFRDTIEVSDDVDTVTARWSFDGEQLRFTNVTPENSPFEVVWESRPWEKTGQ
jgi:TRAP-type C4-dicarboxylate transport system substrate-binding protein